MFLLFNTYSKDSPYPALSSFGELQETTLTIARAQQQSNRSSFRLIENGMSITSKYHPGTSRFAFYADQRHLSPQGSSRFTPDSRIVTCVLDLSDSRPIRQAIGPAPFRGRKKKGCTVLCCAVPTRGGRACGFLMQVTTTSLLPCPPQQPPHGTADNDAVGLWSTQDPDPDPDPQLAAHSNTFCLPLPPSPILTYSASLFPLVPVRQPPAPAPTSVPASATTAAKDLLVLLLASPNSRDHYRAQAMPCLFASSRPESLTTPSRV